MSLDLHRSNGDKKRASTIHYYLIVIRRTYETVKAKRQDGKVVSKCQFKFSSGIWFCDIFSWVIH